jgi:hypothetical protein
LLQSQAAQRSRNRLDPAFGYASTGPGGGADIGVAASAVTKILPNTIELDLAISSATLHGVRSLFITTSNNDRATRPECCCACPLCAELLLCCSALHATTLERMSLARMSHPRCVSNSTMWKAGEISTYSTFSVEENWKGEAGAQAPQLIRIRLLGGAVAGLTSHVSGVPRFRSGEDVLIFLQPASGTVVSVLGWAQGTFRIRRDPRTGQRVVTQDTASFATFNPATRRFETMGIGNLPLANLRARVESAIARNRE